MAAIGNLRLRNGLMATFRDAHAARDARLDAASTRDGTSTVAGRGVTKRSSVGAEDLQRSVARGIDTLMNTVNLASTLDLTDFPDAARSVINFGFPDLVHRTIDELRVVDIGREIALALRTYETRIVPETLAVTRDVTLDQAELQIRFVVRAELDCDPLNLPVEFVADVERDSGKIVVSRR